MDGITEAITGPGEAATADAGQTAGGSVKGGNAPAQAAKAAADAAAPKDSPVAVDEIEFEEEGDDGKLAKVKLPRAQAIERLRTAARAARQAAAREAELQQIWERDIAPRQQLLARVDPRNPMSIFDVAKELGVDPEEAARAYAQEWVKRQEMTPDQRRALALEEENTRLRAEHEARAAKEQEEIQNAEVAKLKVQVEEEIVKAAVAADLPKHPMALSLLNAFAAAQLRDNPRLQEPDLHLAAESVKDFAASYFKSWAAGLTYEQVVQAMPEVVKLIREGDLKSATSGRPSTPSRNGRSVAEPKEYLNPEEWRRRYLETLK
jgi:hypothetical protein